MLPPLPPRLTPPPPREPPPMDPLPPCRCATPTPAARLQHNAIRNTSFIWRVPLLGSLPPHGLRCKGKPSWPSWAGLPAQSGVDLLVRGRRPRRPAGTLQDARSRRSGGGTAASRADQGSAPPSWRHKHLSGRRGNIEEP